MKKPRRKKERVRIRKGGFKDELYLNRKGQWVNRKDAAIFSSQAAAEEFAERHGVTDFGLF